MTVLALVLFAIVSESNETLPHAYTPPTGEVSAAAYKSVQQAVDANPGKMVFVPAGDHGVDRAIRITTDGTGLYGPGRIIQSNPDRHIVEIVGASDVRVFGLTLTRAAEQVESYASGVYASECARLELDGVRVVDNRSTAGAIHLDRCRASQVRDCTILNYKRIAIDDRTENELYGYAFRVIDGTGILVTRGSGILVQNNRVIEENLFPFRETKDRYRLGEFTEGKRPMNKGRLAPEGSYANNWHQGSAITVTSPEETDHVVITGNYIENAAQGIDIHADHVICSSNIIKYAFIGIKCMHGSRNVIITNNNVSHNDLWGLVMLPGALSHADEPGMADAPARPANRTEANIIANNIFSDFGFGFEYYNWEGAKGGVISLESGQLPENPIMEDIIIQGNIVYQTGREEILVDGATEKAPPRYEYAVFITPEPAPRGLHFIGNVFHPGRAGLSNVELTP